MPISPPNSTSAVGDRVPLGDAREAVLAQRRRRGMVLDLARPRHVELRVLLHQPDPELDGGSSTPWRRGCTSTLGADVDPRPATPTPAAM
jgi:hypothetical protein